jgi:hypothetical protein
MMTRVVEENEMIKVVDGERMMSTGRLWGAGAAIAVLVSSMHAFGAEALSAQEPQELPRCADIEGGPQCPVDDEKMERNGVLAFFDFDQLNFGAEAKPCVCGNTVLRDCDESLPADQPGSCVGGVEQKLPVLLELTKNDRVCEVIDGERVCWEEEEED